MACTLQSLERMWRLVRLGFLLVSTASSARGNATARPTTVQVHGYTTKRGTYVAPHRRTAPDQTRENNWSHAGNVNPDTGKAGSKP